MPPARRAPVGSRAGPLLSFTIIAMVRLEAILSSWKTIRQDTAQAVEDCPAGELDFKPTPELDSFRQIAMHCLNAGNGLTGLLLEGEESLTGPEFREKMKKHFSGLTAEA